MDGVDEVRQIDDTHLHWVTSVGPATREFDATVTEQHPDERVAWSPTTDPSTPESSPSTAWTTSRPR